MRDSTGLFERRAGAWLATRENVVSVGFCGYGLYRRASATALVTQCRTMYGQGYAKDGARSIAEASRHSGLAHHRER